MMLRILLAALLAVYVRAQDVPCKQLCPDNCFSLTCIQYEDAVCVQDSCTCEVSWTLNGENVTAECEDMIDDDLEDIEDDLEAMEDDLENEIDSDDEDDDGVDMRGNKKRKMWKLKRKQKKQAWKNKMGKGKKNAAGQQKKRFPIPKIRNEEKRQMLLKKWADKGLTAKVEKFTAKWAKKDEKRENRKERRQERKQAMTPEELEEWKAEKQAKKGNKFANRKQKMMNRKQKRMEAKGNMEVAASTN